MVVALPEGHVFPASFVEAVREETGLTLLGVSVDGESLSALLSGGSQPEVSPAGEGEPGPPAPGAEIPQLVHSSGAPLLVITEAGTVAELEGTPYEGLPALLGHGADCQLVDLAWYYANDLALPADLDTADQSALVEGSVFLPALSATASGPRWELVPGSCEATDVFLTAAPTENYSRAEVAAVDRLTGFLISEEGQALLGEGGVAFPMGVAPGQSVLVRGDDAETKVVRPAG